jgi:hypothetical protein
VSEYVIVYPLQCIGTITPPPSLPYSLTHSCTLLLCRAADIHGAHDELTRVLGGAGIINTTVATHSGVCEWVAQPEGGTTLIQMGDVVDRYVLTH